ncbi:MAG: deoxyguanosinetriphosphate triphosphohydrolase [Alphaproteobacteria bacterium]
MTQKSSHNGAGLAPFAVTIAESRGRRFGEDESSTRSPYQRDRDRIIHSTAFRRLQYKTQVFVYHEGDYYRTRLTHSLEVAQIARSISRTLGLDEDLAEALSLAHDLGHSPFAHAGEDALKTQMRPYGGFDHNAQSLKIVTELEQRYGPFDGLNLTWETLEGLVKHNGPLVGDGVARDTLPGVIQRQDDALSFDLGTYASAEAQVAALSDDIAYNNHDIDDGLRAGLFTLDDLAALPLVGDVVTAVRALYPNADKDRMAHEVVRRLIDHMVRDLLAETGRRIKKHQPQSAQDVRDLPEALVAFSEDMIANDRELRRFLREHMYFHYKVNRMTSKARRVVGDLFPLYLGEPEILPDPWRALATTGDVSARARIVCDFIAGMTDRFAIEEHRRLFDLSM